MKSEGDIGGSAKLEGELQDLLHLMGRFILALRDEAVADALRLWGLRHAIADRNTGTRSSV